MTTRGLLARITAAGLLAATPAAAQDPPLWGGLKSGPHPVGYHRVAVDGGGVHVWFPAGRTRGEPMRLEGYFDGAARASLSTSLREAPTAAYSAASPGDGPFPLVLYASDPGLPAPDNTVLAEYLASHGYVVAAPIAPAGLDAAFNALRGFSHVGRDAVAVVTRDRGWPAAVEFAARCPAVRAVLVLDPPADARVAVAGGRSLAVLGLRPDGAGPGNRSQGLAGVTVTVPRSTAGSFTDRPAFRAFLDETGDVAPDHRRLIAGVTHAFLDGALRAWGPSLEELAERLTRAGLSVREPAR